MGFIVNGSISYNIVSGGGLDGNGNPMKADENWSENIPCHIDTINHSERGRYIGGNFTVCSYYVFVEKSMQFESGRIQIILNGKELGEFQIQDFQLKNKTGRIQITV